MLYIFYIYLYITVHAYIIMLKLKNKKGSIMKTVALKLSRLIVKDRFDLEMVKMTIRQTILCSVILLAGKFFGFM